MGARLLAFAEQWASTTGGLDWIDLQVLSENERAIRQYVRAGFIKIGEVPDLFRIDGRALAYTSMAKPLQRPHGRAAQDP